MVAACASGLLTVGAPVRIRAEAAPATGTITVVMTGFRSSNGFMRIALFHSKHGFPGDHRRSFRSGTGRIVSGAATFTFTNVPPGTYAIAVLHDKNGNGKIREVRHVAVPDLPSFLCLPGCCAGCTGAGYRFL